MTADLIEALVGPHVDQYETNARFHHGVNSLAAACSALVELAAIGADTQTADDAERVREAMRAVPMMTLEPGDPGYDRALALARERHPSAQPPRPQLVAVDDPTEP